MSESGEGSGAESPIIPRDPIVNRRLSRNLAGVRAGSPSWESSGRESPVLPATPRANKRVSLNLAGRASPSWESAGRESPVIPNTPRANKRLSLGLAGRASPSWESSGRESVASMRAASPGPSKRMSLPVMPGAGGNAARGPSPLSVEWEEKRRSMLG